MKYIMIGLVCLSLVGCSNTPEQNQIRNNIDSQFDQSRNYSPMPVSTNQRVTIERVDVIYDDIAYNQKRGIYIIRDTKTGQEFIGVSGVGITEIGLHSQGKTSHPDER